MRGLPLALALSVPLWLAIVAGASLVIDAVRVGKPPFALRSVEPFGGEP